MDQFGHFGYAAYFIILELIHEHGVGGIVTMSQSRLAQNLRSRWPQVRLYLDFSRTSGKVEYTLSGTEVQLQNKKFIQRQGKLKFKTPSILSQHSVKTPQEGEREEERERHTPKPPKGDWPGFDIFWKAYPNKKAKGKARKAWNRIRPNEDLLAEILAAIGKQSRSEQWTNESGKYIPHPTSWLNADCWEDELKSGPHDEPRTEWDIEREKMKKRQSDSTATTEY